MDPSILAGLDPQTLRVVLPGYLAGHIADADAAKRNRERVSALAATWTDEDCRGVLRALASGGDGYRVFPADHACRSLSRVWSHDAIPSHAVHGLHHLRDAAASGPTVILCNHFSYYDATATDALLAWAGAEDLADRLLFAAGPKVYQHLFRRVAAACLNTVQVPQSVKLAHTDRLGARELAHHAQSSLDATRDAIVDHGLILLLYPEGTRTRDGRMQSFLRGVHRYLSLTEGIRVVPAAITGTDRLMSVEDDERIAPSDVTLSFQPPLQVGPDGSPRDVLESTFARISGALPAEHRPAPGTPALS